MGSVRTARSLAELRDQFEKISDRASALANSVAPATIARRPKPDAWSVAECLAHLNLSADNYFPIWAAESDRARQQGLLGGEAYRLDLWGRMLVWTLEPPPKFRFSAPPKFQPASNVESAEQVLPAFLDHQRRILDALNQARGLAIDKIKIASPFDARMRYSIWSSFCVTASHERRHLSQAQQALESLQRAKSATA